MNIQNLGIRWTIGDASARGFEELRLSIWGAHKIFGAQAELAVCVNSVSIAEAQARTGDVPSGVRWIVCPPDAPEFLKPHLDAGMAEGVAWKFSPLQLFSDRFELALDNDCILWQMPQAIAMWLESNENCCVVAEDVVPAFGQFAAFCQKGPRNGGIRGLPPGFDYEKALREMLRRNPIIMQSELDEQGLQTATLEAFCEPLLVTLDEVSICSPFYPHLPHLGRCGAHFVGSNARHIAWDYYDRPADEWMQEHWAKLRGEVYARVGLSS